jgi:hypothetical protein
VTETVTLGDELTLGALPVSVLVAVAEAVAVADGDTGVADDDAVSVGVGVGTGLEVTDGDAEAAPVGGAGGDGVGSGGPSIEKSSRCIVIGPRLAAVTEARTRSAPSGAILLPVVRYLNSGALPSSQSESSDEIRSPPPVNHVIRRKTRSTFGSESRTQPENSYAAVSRTWTHWKTSGDDSWPVVVISSDHCPFLAAFEG